MSYGPDHQLVASWEELVIGRGGEPRTEAGVMSVRSWATRHELALFFVLAFAVSWAAWPLVLANPASSPLMPFGPAVAALAVAALTGGPSGVWRLLRQLARWRVRPLWFAAALGVPAVLTGLAAVTTVAAGAPAPDVAAYTDWAALLATLVSTMVIVGLFEELGWRGFALPRMERRHTALAAALALGVVWAAWHLPELVSDPGEREPLAFLVIVVAYSVLIAWLYNSTDGSLPVAIVFHAAANTAARFVMPEFGGSYQAVAWWSLAGAYVLAAVVVSGLAGRELTRGGSRPPRGVAQYSS